MFWPRQKETRSHAPDDTHMAVVASLCDHSIRERALHPHALLFNSEEWELFMKSFACVLGFDNVNVRYSFFCTALPHSADGFLTFSFVINIWIFEYRQATARSLLTFETSSPLHSRPTLGVSRLSIANAACDVSLLVADVRMLTQS
jgi:hypothetical protein